MDPRIPKIKTTAGKLSLKRVERILVFPIPGELRKAVNGRCIKPQNFSGFARRRPATIGNDICSHRGTARAIALVDILDGALALIAAGKIQIDIGPFATLFGKETFEEQIHADWIDGRNSQDIANRAVCCGTASLHEDLVSTAELDDVPDDQEITFK